VTHPALPALSHFFFFLSVFSLESLLSLVLFTFNSLFCLVVCGPIDGATAADEMVTFEGAQALPLFVFYTE